MSGAQEQLSFAQTRALMRSDFERLVGWYGGGSLPQRVFWYFQPNYQALFFYRLYRWLFVKGWKNSARLLFLYSLYATGVEISPTTSIGAACLLEHAFGIILCGRIGARCSFAGQCGTGGGIGECDIGGGPGLPVVGDDVRFGPKALVLGPIRIGSRVAIGASAIVTVEVPDDSEVLPLPSKIIRVKMGRAESAP